MTWLQLGVEAPADIAADLANQLHILGALAITQSDAAAGLNSDKAITDSAIIEPPLGTTPLWIVTRLQAIFALDIDLTEVRRLLQKIFADNKLATPQCTVDFVEEQDWQHNWKQYAVCQLFGDKLMLAPREKQVQIAADQLVMRLDPGLAFGTGSHATTALCLEWLAQQDLRETCVLDFGCGSGILSIAAALLGAKRVVAVDHDSQALLATRENAAYNGLSEDQISVVDAVTNYSPQKFNLVVANILTNTLVDYAQTLQSALSERGILVLSGILENQVQTVRAAYEEFDFEVTNREPWVCLVGCQRS